MRIDFKFRAAALAVVAAGAPVDHRRIDSPRAGQRAGEGG
ncbi:MAG: hypothetical protein RL310_345 [Actinomycetota bacterium]